MVTMHVVAWFTTFLSETNRQDTSAPACIATIGLALKLQNGLVSVAFERGRWVLWLSK